MPRRLLVLLILALSLRLGWAFVQPATDTAIDGLPDQREYLSLGRNLLQLRSLQFYDPRFRQTIYAYRMPGYPMLIAACGGSVRVVRIAQCFIDVSTVLAVYGIARRAGLGVVPAEVAAAVVAVNPFMIYFSGAILTETCFTATVTWNIYLLTGGARRREVTGARGVGRFSDPAVTEATHAAHARAATFIRDSLLVASTAILGALVRPTAILIFPLLALVTKKLRRPRLIAVVLSISLVTLGWGIRNRLLFGHPAFTTTNSGVTFYDGFNPAATGASDQRFFDQMPAERSMSEWDRSESLGRLARDWAIRHPWQTVLLSGRKITRGWSPVPLSQDFGKIGYRIVAAGYSLPFDLAVLVGIFAGRINCSRKWILFMPAIGVTIAQVLTVGSLRYRIPAEPVMAVLAAAGLSGGRGKEITKTQEMTNDQDPRPNQ